MTTEEKTIEVFKHIGEQYEHINKYINYHIGLNNIEYKRREEFYNTVIDFFLYADNKRLDKCLEVIKKGEFPYYIIGVINNLAVLPKSSFNYKKKSDYLTISIDDTYED